MVPCGTIAGSVSITGDACTPEDTVVVCDTAVVDVVGLVEGDTWDALCKPIIATAAIMITIIAIPAAIAFFPAMSIAYT